MNGFENAGTDTNAVIVLEASRSMYSGATAVYKELRKLARCGMLKIGKLAGGASSRASIIGHLSNGVFLHCSFH